MLDGARLWWQSTMPLETIWMQVAVAVAIFLLFLLLRGFFTKVIFKIILSLTRKTKTDLDTNIMLAFEGPLKVLITVIGIYLSLTYLPLGPAAYATINQVYRSLIVILIAWGLYNVCGSKPFKGLTDKFKVDPVLVDFLTKVLRVVILAMALLMVADVWDYPITGLITGLGLGGLAFALAAKDAVSNIFGGIVIILDKPFSVGDWIWTPSVEGTIEEVSFRSTKIRTFAHALITMPNSVIANEPITNWTRMGKRRITFNLGVTYDTPIEKLKTCVEGLKVMLVNHPEIHKETIFVTFNQFNDSSLDIFLYFFTITTKWAEYLRVRENVNFKILEILEQEGVSVAFPSRSIYLEKGSGLT